MTLTLGEDVAHDQDAAQPPAAAKRHCMSPQLPGWVTPPTPISGWVTPPTPMGYTPESSEDQQSDADAEEIKNRLQQKQLGIDLHDARKDSSKQPILTPSLLPSWPQRPKVRCAKQVTLQPTMLLSTKGGSLDVLLNNLTNPVHPRTDKGALALEKLAQDTKLTARRPNMEISVAKAASMMDATSKSCSK